MTQKFGKSLTWLFLFLLIMYLLQNTNVQKWLIACKQTQSEAPSSQEYGLQDTMVCISGYFRANLANHGIKYMDHSIHCNAYVRIFFLKAYHYFFFVHYHIFCHILINWYILSRITGLRKYKHKFKINWNVVLSYMFLDNVYNIRVY